MQHEPPKSREDRFNEALSSLADIIKPLENILTAGRTQKPVNGSFRVSGYANFETSDRNPTIRLRAGEWLKRPSDKWITVGLKGSIKSGDEHSTFTGNILDKEGQALAGCSRFSFTHEGSVTMASELQGLWTGTYVCGGTKTLASLDIRKARTHRSGARQGQTELKGLFNFTVGKRVPVKRGRSTGGGLSNTRAFGTGGAGLPEAVRQAMQRQAGGQDSRMPIVFVMDEESGELRPATDNAGDQSELAQMLQRALRGQRHGYGDRGPLQAVELEYDDANPRARALAARMMEQLRSGGATEEEATEEEEEAEDD